MKVLKHLIKLSVKLFRDLTLHKMVFNGGGGGGGVYLYLKS